MERERVKVKGGWVGVRLISAVEVFLLGVCVFE